MTPPDDLSKWSLHCFCLGARQTPHSAVRQGNCGRLLFEAETWCDLARIRRRLSVSESEIRELETFGLLERDGSHLRRACPALGPDVILPLRTKMASHALALLRAEGTRIGEIAREMEALGLSHALYAVIFGHVMDGLLWHYLRSRMDIPDTTPTAQFPLWRGVFWAVYPPQPEAIGTNQVILGDSVMILVWSQRTDAMLTTMRQEAWPTEFLRFLRGEVETSPPEAISAGLLDASGIAAVPVFGTARCDRLAQLTEGLAGSVARYIFGATDMLSSLDDLPAPQRNVIVIHEFIWAMQTAFRSVQPRPWAQVSEAEPPTTARDSIIVHLARNSA